MSSVFSIQKPQNPLPIIYDSPHSGMELPADFGAACNHEDLRNTADHFVDDLFAGVREYGGTLLSAQISRSYIDVNRARDDIDPALLDKPWPDGLQPIAPSSRSDAGIGLIRRLIKPGHPIYDRALPADEIMRRIETVYDPYHTQLEQLIREAHYNFGQVWHINCHSMPSASAKPKNNLRLIGQQTTPSDFVIGDLDGRSASKDFTHSIRDFLQGLNYSVTINDPFKGVEIIKRHSNPARGVHSIQLEINKALYMDEMQFEKHSGYEKLKTTIHDLSRFIANYTKEQLISKAAD